MSENTENKPVQKAKTERKAPKPNLENLERLLTGWKAQMRAEGATHFEFDTSNPRKYVVTAYDKKDAKDRKALGSKTIHRN